MKCKHLFSEILKNLLCINILHIYYRYIIILNTKGSIFNIYTFKLIWQFFLNIMSTIIIYINKCDCYVKKMVIWNDFHETICKHGNLCLGHLLPDIQLNAIKKIQNKQKKYFCFPQDSGSGVLKKCSSSVSTSSFLVSSHFNFF